MSTNTKPTYIIDERNFAVRHITIFVGLAITTLAAFGCYLVHQETYILAVIAAGIACTTLFYHAQNLRLNFLVNNAKLEQDRILADQKIAQDKKVAALNLVTFSKDVADLNFKAVRFLHQHESLSGDAFLEMLEMDNNRETRIALVWMINHFEKVAIAIQEGIADEVVLKKFYRSLFEKQGLILERYIEARRRRDKIVDLWKEFESVMKQWNIRLN